MQVSNNYPAVVNSRLANSPVPISLRAFIGSVLRPWLSRNLGRWVWPLV